MPGSVAAFGDVETETRTFVTPCTNANGIILQYEFPDNDATPRSSYLLT
ncbi:hypothetical protein [Borrelia persica]|nr:hypothetical protein [Borrelia persica]